MAWANITGTNNDESPRGMVVFAGRTFTEYRTPAGTVVTVRHRPKHRSKAERRNRRARFGFGR
jgi:hypothetical protein